MLIAAFEDQIVFLAVLASSGSRFALCKVIHLFFACVICAESSLLRRRIKCDRSQFSNPVTSSVASTCSVRALSYCTATLA